ncbi:hypothetical protein RHMOL_Rhmol04G0159500 [Rhododendron molle]|uniref:Uncharacterized protein n=1 Tax=Rhododendron molle TaxID=49168 RepID=A0ACC0P232_RHOML|nr:hypothetical protein RHMOL_Rhmol04G0159500 [Rhododendron molle]
MGLCIGTHAFDGYSTHIGLSDNFPFSCALDKNRDSDSFSFSVFDFHKDIDSLYQKLAGKCSKIS